MSISYLHPLVHSFNAHANTQRAQATAKYFKNNFEFYGFDAKTRRQLIQSFYKQQGIGQASQVNEICYWAFNQHEREWQYFAMEHAFKHRKHWTPETIQLIHFMLITKSWWDTVDYIATHCVSFMALQMPKLLPTIHQWNQDQNIWLIRTSIIYQNLFKKKTDSEILFGHILPHLHRKEFFIQKAIGWALRQYAQTDAQAVLHFCQTQPLSALSKREALKHF
jgi:3-methyladenine DNA glycosylase AlkD